MSQTTEAVQAAMQQMWVAERSANSLVHATAASMRCLQAELVDLWSGSITQLARPARLNTLLTLAESIAGEDFCLDGPLADPLIWTEVAQHADEHSDCIEWPDWIQLVSWAHSIRPRALSHSTPRRRAWAAAYAILWWASWRNRMDATGYELTPKGKP